MARRHATNRRFSFGSGKFGDLAGFTSALVLGIVAIAVAAESVTRFYTPVPIQYREAIFVAGVGLLVNIVSAFALHDHEHDHGESHERDHNLGAAYVHVLADAATSVLALAALGAGAFFGLAFLDPVVGLLGAIVIARWSIQLVRQTGLVLLDFEDDPALATAIRHTLEDDLGARIADIHLWRLGPGHRGLIVSLVSPVPCSADSIKNELRQRHPGLSHVTVEVAVCEECTS
jgi:cation diffusion facilitator family transporter